MKEKLLQLIIPEIKKHSDCEICIKMGWICPYQDNLEEISHDCPFESYVRKTLEK